MRNLLRITCEIGLNGALFRLNGVLFRLNGALFRLNGFYFVGNKLPTLRQHPAWLIG